MYKLLCEKDRRNHSLNDRIVLKQTVQQKLVNMGLCAVPIWPGDKKPAFQAKSKRHDDRPWTEIVEEDKGKLYDMEKFDLGIKGTQLTDIGEQHTFFLWADVDFHMEEDAGIFMSRIYPIIQNKGFLITRSPSGGYHIGLRTTQNPRSTARVFEYPDSGITVDFRASQTQCVVIDTAGNYNMVEIPDELIYMDFDVFKQLFVEKLGFVSPIPTKSKMDGVLRECVRQYLAGEPKSVDIDTNLWMLGVIRYLMSVHGDHEDPIVADAVKALDLCPGTNKDEGWVRTKVQDCLETQKPLSLKSGPSKSPGKMGEEELAKIILDETKMYSDKSLSKIYITTNGFLEDVTRSIKYSIAKKYGTDINCTKQVEHFIIAHADNVPETNPDSIRFKNGVYNTKTSHFDFDDVTLCLVGYPDYDYSINARPEKFISMIENQVKPESRDNLIAWLKKLPTASKEIRMAVMYGEPGSGKTTMAEILNLSLDTMGYRASMKDFFTDRATMSEIAGKTYLYFQDAPKKWDDIDRLKQITGEYSLNVRGMYKESIMTRNMLNITISTNTLPKIDSEDEGPMWDRLSLIQFNPKNFRGTEEEIEDYPMLVAKEEGEAIVSYCLNLSQTKPRFDDSRKTKQVWHEISSPELRAIKDNFRHEENYEGLSIHQVMTIINAKYPDEMYGLKSIRTAIKTLGYVQKGEKFIGLKQIILEHGQQKIE